MSLLSNDKKSVSLHFTSKKDWNHKRYENLNYLKKLNLKHDSHQDNFVRIKSFVLMSTNSWKSKNLIILTSIRLTRLWKHNLERNSLTMNFNQRCQKFIRKLAHRQWQNGPKNLNIIRMRKSKSRPDQNAFVTTSNHHNGRTNKPPRPMIKRDNQKYAHRIQLSKYHRLSR